MKRNKQIKLSRFRQKQHEKKVTKKHLKSYNFKRFANVNLKIWLSSRFHASERINEKSRV